MHMPHNHLFAFIIIVLITGLAACLIEPPIEEVSRDPTIDIEATVEARLAQKRIFAATVEAGVMNRISGQSKLPSTKSKAQEPDILPLGTDLPITPTPTICTLSDESIVKSGWSGRGRAANSCNFCSCDNGILGCTKMACANQEDSVLSAPSSTPQLRVTAVLLPTATIQPEPEREQYQKGLQYLDIEEYDQAIKQFTEALNLDPEHKLSYFKRGYAYNESGRYEMALKDYSSVIRLDPNEPNAYQNKGWAYMQLDQYSKAIFAFDKAISLNLTYALAYFNRGKAYDHLGKYEKGDPDFKKACLLLWELCTKRCDAKQRESEHEFSGDAPGKLVTAWVNGEKVGEVKPMGSNRAQPNPYLMRIAICTNQRISLEDSTISFQIDGIQAEQQSVLIGDKRERLELRLPSLVPTPTVEPTIARSYCEYNMVVNVGHKYFRGYTARFKIGSLWADQTIVLRTAGYDILDLTYGRKTSGTNQPLFWTVAMLEQSTSTPSPTSHRHLDLLQLPGRQ